MVDIKLNGVKNIRDLGGIVVKGGKLKRHKLLRSPCLDKLTQKDMDILVNEYKLSTIIDLRTDREVIERKDLEMKNVKYIHMPIFNERVPGITHEKQENANRDSEINMMKMYQGILSGEYLEKVKEIIKKIIHMQDDEYSVLFHCTAGKDRTGIIAAILLLILGADKQTVIDDYLYTNKVNKKNATKIYWKIKIFERNQKKAENIRNVFLAKPEYIDTVFKVIDEDWNGIDNFITNGLNITKEEIERFREKMIDKLVVS